MISPQQWQIQDFKLRGRIHRRVEKGVGAGGGSAPSQLGVWGSAVSSPIGVWGEAPEAFEVPLLSFRNSAILNRNMNS